MVKTSLSKVITAASLALVLSPFASIVASLAGALPAEAGEVPFDERVISTTADGATSVFATDVDGDGDIDVLSAGATMAGNDGKITWYESDGGSPPTFTERLIATPDGAFSVFATDVDGDGDTDVLSASVLDDKIAWYESDGGSPPTFTERLISTTADGALSVFATDMDGDGDTDVLSTSFLDNKIAWYESDGGSPPAFTEQVISTTANEAFSVFATDVDGDGDIDALSASKQDNKIAWYENTMPSCGDCPTDVDGDGDTGPFDLATLLGAWGPIADANCLDADGDGNIGPFDLAILLGTWGPCP